MKILLLFCLISTHLKGEGRNENHLGGVLDMNSGEYVPGSGTAAPAQGTTTTRALAPHKVCVCQYQETPRNCASNTSETTCRNQHDCIWTRHGRSAAVCYNWHREYCETEFQERPPERGCTSSVVIPSGTQPPLCTERAGGYFYTYHGHGPRIESFLDTVVQVVRGSSSLCNYSFKDQSCQTFAIGGNHEINGFPDVRERINSRLRPLLRGSQHVTVTANQLNAYDTTTPPYVAKNPWYSFTLNKDRITNENAASCDTDMPCNGRLWGEHFMCYIDSGFRRNVCCCGQDLFPLPAFRCRWRTGVLTCPE